MEQANASNVVGTPVWMVKSFAVVVTADVCLAVARHWRGYDVIDRLLAVTLVALLVTIPAVATWGRQETRRIEWSNLMPAYMLLMLATVLFGMQ
jgi:hypothetical protein